MTSPTFVAVMLGSISSITALRAEPEKIAAWQPVTWNGEHAFAAVSGEWKAIVSVERGRLVYFGAAKEEHNLLFAPSTRGHVAGWGGHRIWLGPQTSWVRNWPPPDAWEHSAAAVVAIDGARLVLTLSDSPDGWPRLTREYFWRDGRLHCNARASGGTRDAQIIHILQVPALAEVELQATPTADAPRGYVLVHLGRQPSPEGKFSPPKQVAEVAGKLQLKFTNTMEKLGFTPQPLLARIGHASLRVERGESAGNALTLPDEGFATQVYLGNDQSPLIELEQLSPLWRAGEDANFEIVIEGR